MKVGLFITSQHKRNQDMVAALGEQITMVHHARDRGWDSLFTGQHYLNEGDNQRFQIVSIPDPADAGFGNAGMTIGLGILLINLHNPVYVAETVATMDIFAKGNFIFGIGLGYRATEFDAFNAQGIVSSVSKNTWSWSNACGRRKTSPTKVMSANSTTSR